MQRLESGTSGTIALFVAGVLAAPIAHASDHLDTPTVIADPAADIGDVYAWTSPDGRRLNLAMNIVGGRFSDRLQYVFHIDSGKRFGKTTATTAIVCRFDAENTVECWAGDADYVHGDANKPNGLEGRHRRFRVFAGLRDDPFFNNVKGTRSAYEAATDALKSGAKMDAAGCPGIDMATAQKVLDRWRLPTAAQRRISWPAGSRHRWWSRSNSASSIAVAHCSPSGEELTLHQPYG